MPAGKEKSASKQELWNAGEVQLMHHMHLYLLDFFWLAL